MGFAFGRDKRLGSAAEFKQVFDRTDIKVSCRQLLILAKVGKQENPRLGLVVAKKNIRHAVSRNRAKRHIRESFRLSQSRLDHLDVVVLVRRGFGELEDSEMNRLLARQWLKLSQRLEAWKASH
ncbi:ribonuclease P protein component [Endozoicomonas sp. Mp262]|uniref:ribonuclease P protein component n=1 Tax=Endozoicomonas sp. Mp262 TaxID=2919499 RepID=UPI0021DA0B4F